MKNPFVSAGWMAVGAAVLLPAALVAQVPFSSTQAPGLSPFNRGNNLPPASTPVPRATGNQPQQMMPGNSLNGGYPSATAVTGVDPDHKLGPRDQLSYSVAEDRDGKVHELSVTDSGEVELPIGSLRVKAAGKTTLQLTSDIKNALEREYYKPGHATVSLGLRYAVTNATKGKVYFTGEVSGKGAIDLPSEGQLTVYQAILQQGGFTAEADTKGVFIYRKGGPAKGIQVNCKAISNGDTSKDVVLQPGDTVKIKRRIIGFEF